MPLAVVFVVILCCAALSSCNDQNEDMQTDDQYSQTVELKQIPLEDALATLEDFLLSNEQDMCATRSDASKKIADITTYYGTGGSTRAALETIPMPILSTLRMMVDMLCWVPTMLYRESLLLRKEDAYWTT